MSFVTALALAVGLLVGAPLAAHLLRRGKPVDADFPAARLVGKKSPTARQRRRIEDRGLLLTRSLMVLLLALLGATPLIRCNRLSLDRQAGASVALAIVLDDSLSMRATTAPGSPTRFEAARRAALELVDSGRGSDAFALVLAGKPPRLVVPSTTNPAAIRAALKRAQVSDRATDAAAAAKLAAGALRGLPHVDKRVVVLSDRAGDVEAPEPPVQLWHPVESLARPRRNCGIASARRAGPRVLARVVCNGVAAGAARADGGATTRPLELRSADEASRLVARTDVATGPGAQLVAIDATESLGPLEVRLGGGPDAIARDDTGPVAPEAGQQQVGVVADTSEGSLRTGGAPVVEQALTALEEKVRIRPLPLVPATASDLASLDLLILDDPSGLGPDARNAILSWARGGRIALALLGKNAGNAELASSLEPFLRGSGRWLEHKAPGLDGASLGWLGDDGAGLDQLGAKRRVPLAANAPDGATVRLRWSDGEPFLLELPVGRGLLVTVGLPSSVSASDLALRPGFLALLDHYRRLSRSLRGPTVAEVGTAWKLMPPYPDAVTGPAGPLQPARVGDATADGSARVYVPDLRGRYEVTRGAAREERIATLVEAELEATAAPPSTASGARKGASTMTTVDLSREIAMGLLALLFVEIALRLVGQLRQRRAATT